MIGTILLGLFLGSCIVLALFSCACIVMILLDHKNNP